MSQPGLPALPAASQPPAPPPPATSDNAKLPTNGNPPQWGLYLNGKPVIVAESVATFNFKAVSDIPTYPQEQGAFQSYNKVQLPNTVRLRYKQGGSLADRTDFLNSCEAAKRSTQLYDCATPEVTYPSMNVKDYDYDRTATNGLTLLQVDLMLEQVVITGSGTLSNTSANGQPAISNAKNPGANDAQNNGAQQPQDISSSQQTALNSAAPTYNGGMN